MEENYFVPSRIDFTSAQSVNIADTSYTMNPMILMLHTMFIPNRINEQLFAHTEDAQCIVPVFLLSKLQAGRF